MIPVIGTEKLGLSAAAIGALAALEGGGAFAGALLIAAIGVRPGWYRRLYFFGTASYSAFAFVVGWMTETPPLAVVIFMAGLAAAGFSTMQTTLIYGIAPPEMRGRMLGILSLTIGAGVIGFTNIGLMGELFGGANAVRIVAAEGLVAALVLGLRWPRLWREGDGP